MSICIGEAALHHDMKGQFPDNLVVGAIVWLLLDYLSKIFLSGGHIGNLQ